MSWLRENFFNLLTIIGSVIAIYLALNDRITVLEQKAYALEKDQQRVEETLQTSITEIKVDIKEVNKKTDDLVKYLLPRQ